MPEYFLVYQRSTGDEDPDSNHSFKASDDAKARKKAKTFGRSGDYYTLYKKVGDISIVSDIKPTIVHPSEVMTSTERADQMWRVHPTDLDRLKYAQARYSQIISRINALRSNNQYTDEESGLNAARQNLEQYMTYRLQDCSLPRIALLPNNRR